MIIDRTEERATGIVKADHVASMTSTPLIIVQCQLWLTAYSQAYRIIQQLLPWWATSFSIAYLLQSTEFMVYKQKSWSNW